MDILNRQIFTFQIEGKNVLGFDTGLKAQAFAQARLAQAITRPGTIIYPDGKTETLQAQSVTESSEASGMVVWGPLFPGEELIDVICDPDSKKEAFDLFGFWLRARILLEDNPGEEHSYPGPAGAMVITGKTPAMLSLGTGIPGNSKYPVGTVFFPPAQILKRIIDNRGEKAVFNAMSFVHPDLESSVWINQEGKNPESIAFSAGIMLYRIFCGSNPYTGIATAVNLDELRQNIREAVYIPPKLAAPGLDSDLASHIDRAMSPIQPMKKGGKKPAVIRPSPEEIKDFLRIHKKTFSACFEDPGSEEIQKISEEREQLIAWKERKIKTRRYVRRHNVRIAVVLSVIIAVFLGINSYARHQASLPHTRGMTPLEVVETYYGAFGEMDHILMEACVQGRTGRSDIEMVIYLYVTSRQRMAQETSFRFLTASEWIERGSPGNIPDVFGVTDLTTRIIFEEEDNVLIEAEFLLWMPGAYFLNLEGSVSIMSPEEITIPPPGSIPLRDVLNVTWNRDSWLISGIERTEL